MVERNPTYLLGKNDCKIVFEKNQQTTSFIFREYEKSLVLFTKVFNCFISANLIDVVSILKIDKDFKKDACRMFLVYYSKINEKVELIKNRKFEGSTPGLMLTLEKSFDTKNIIKYQDMIDAFLRKFNRPGAGREMLKIEFDYWYKQTYNFYIDYGRNKHEEKDFIPLVKRKCKRKSHESEELNGKKEYNILNDRYEISRKKRRDLSDENGELLKKINTLEQKILNLKRHINFILDQE